MAIKQDGPREPAYIEPGFGATIPGMKVKPVAHEVRAATRKNLEKSGHPQKGYGELSRFIRVINRGEKGPCKGQPFIGCANGEIWPEEAIGDDPSTWLQPGTYMDIPKDVALHLFGNVWDPSLPERQQIINRYGGPKYQAPPNDSVSGRGAPMRVIGPPRVPDIIVVEVNSRGKMDDAFKPVYELYTKGIIGSEVAIDMAAVAAQEPEAKIESANAKGASRQLVTA